MQKLRFIKFFRVCFFVTILFRLVLPATGQDVGPFRPAPYPSSAQVSYVRTWDATAPQQNSTLLISASRRDAKQTTQYFDGLGRLLQSVIKQGSYPAGASPADMVKPVVYDNLGRELRKYLPFAAGNYGGNASVSDGGFKFNPFDQQQVFYSDANSNSPVKGQGEIYYYSKINFESSPLNRPTENYPAGNNWVGSEGTTKRSSKIYYWFNTTADSVKIWTVTNNPAANMFGTYATAAAYPTGTLNKVVATDEQGHQMIEFKDKDDRLVLKKMQLNASADDGAGKGHNGWLCTYYIYDELGQLRAVIQPRAVQQMSISGNWTPDPVSLNELVFRYEYDQRGQMIMKKVPGAGIIYLVYDSRDRLVMTQDSATRAIHKWLYTQYDGLNRPVVTGLITDNINYNNVAYHRLHADTSAAWPNLSAYTNEELTRTFYDNYSWRSGQGSPLTDTRNTGFDNYLQGASNVAWPYPQAVAQSAQLKGLVTGTKTKVLGTAGAFLYSVNFYDEKARAIQVQSQNISGTAAIDIITTQYSWSGQPLLSIVKNEKGIPNAQTSIAITRITYDDLGRQVKVEKRMSNTKVNGGAMPAGWETIVQNEYDALGQIKKRKLGSAPIDSVNYEYNIRGWLLGINRSYAKDTSSVSNWFGFDLGYDKTTFTVDGAVQNYAGSQYNGNIGGMLWKSRGDACLRKYDFVYDAANRLTAADFNQLTGNSFSKGAGLDFSVSGLNYDANGNILNMNQKGWKIGASQMIDSLLYTYLPASNKLLNVLDRNNDTATKLGDFRSSKAYMTALGNNKTVAAVDYTYEANGSLASDKNKDISLIHYNYLSLPDSIVVTGKGTIKYVYDAAGNKLKKISTQGANVTTTIYMFGNFVNDTLSFLPQEEGRVRFKPTGNSLQYDYFLKDHLGNIRMVLTEESQTDPYPAATLETALLSTEKKYYSRIDSGRVNKSSVAGYPQDAATNPNDFVQRLQGKGNNIGAGIVLKVMAGDKFNIKVSSWYRTDGMTLPLNSINPLNDLIAALTGGIVSATAVGGHAVTTTELQNAGVLSPAIGSFLKNRNGVWLIPKAYLNWILFDEQFKYVASSSGAEQVPAESSFGAVPNQAVYTHVKSNLPINKNGYLYVYVSNETPNIDVFFDNLQVTHIRGPLLEETHYYPFGLTMAGISDRAIGELENHRKFVGQDFNNDFNLDWYEFRYRMLNPQIGRFIQVDPLASQYSYNGTYVYSENKPINGIDLEGLEWLPINKDGQGVNPEDKENISGFKWAGYDVDAKTGKKTPKAGTVATAYTFGDEGRTSLSVDEKGNASETWESYSSLNTGDATTDNRISTLHSSIQNKIKEFILKADDRFGIKLRVTDGYRTIAEQDKLYAQGRTEPGRIVTNAKGGYSNHNFGLAVDVVPLQNGQPNYNSNEYSLLGRVGALIGLEWGGDWKSITDMPHFQNLQGLSLSQLRALPTDEKGLPVLP